MAFIAEMDTKMARPRAMSDWKATVTIHRAITSGTRPSIAALAKRVGLSPRTMSRYLKRLKMGAMVCPICHGSGTIRKHAQ